MAIVYAVVARGTVVLAEFAAVSGNAGAVARRILEKLPPDAECRLCFAQDRYIFHVLRFPALTFLCMANDTFGSNFVSTSCSVACNSHFIPAATRLDCSSDVPCCCCCCFRLTGSFECSASRLIRIICTQIHPFL
ncbi:hypothetical protein ABZP36_025159 [Zizania latifolia]